MSLRLLLCANTSGSTEISINRLQTLNFTDEVKSYGLSGSFWINIKAATEM